MVNSILSSPESSESLDKRVCQRIELNKQIQLRLADGQIIYGTTEDISLGGLRIATSDTLDSTIIRTSEQVAMLQIKLLDGQLSPEYPCHIVRCDAGYICLKLDKKKAASFGMMLTRGALKQK
ncbi:MAG: PilZ domain-containing protein [Gammaproteobacteria bacterium]|nr:PilZ domain-containing protein [Gammaproteobacteria bacterium]